MAALIIFRCPHTGMDVQTSLEKQERDPIRAYEAISCPACIRIHFINVITGAVVSQNRSDTPVDEPAHEAEPKAKGK
jgi:hypothetical protein